MFTDFQLTRGVVMKHIYIILYLLSLPLLSAQTDEYIWYETDIFPYIISSGPDKGSGAADLAVDLIDSLISGHSHRKIIMPSKRIQEEIKAGASALWPTAISSPERKEYFYFSRPYIVLKPLKFVSFSIFHPPGEIDEQFFILNPDYQIAIVRGRSL